LLCIDNKHNLWPRLTRVPLSIYASGIEPEEDLGVDDMIPIFRAHSDHASRQRLRKHRLLISNMRPVRQRRMDRPMPSLKWRSFFTPDSREIEQGARAE
jgi:hypothetical protein